MNASMPPESTERNIAPGVAAPRVGVSVPVMVIGAAIASVVLFSALDARRRSLSAPAVVPRTVERGPSEAPPPLFIPPEIARAPINTVELSETLSPRSFPSPAPRLQGYVTPPAPPAIARFEPSPATVENRPVRTSGGATLVIDTSQQRSAGDNADVAAAAPGTGDTNVTAGRARAGTIANRSMTVPQGTLIPGVLETAFNSSRAGFARALVQRDIRGFDGKRVLIPRGSRLIGEYRSDATTGQNRALVNWTRLIRPDGATIAIGSPATDPVGTGGIRAKVDSHFFERFGGAILQSVLDVGVNLASRSVDSPVIVALPGSLQGATPVATRPTEIAPTLRVRQGTSVSVFVARDLDFTEVERPE